MRDLILLRHAQAEPTRSEVEETERPLSEQGMAEAKAAGTWLAAHGFVPALAVCSTARRARMTAELAMQAWPDCPVRCEEGIFDASPGELLALLDGHAQCARLMLVGHNPGIEQLLALLTQGRSDDYRGMPPAALAWITLADRIEPGAGTLHAYWAP